ncbi:SpoIID/LytB domain-containing protein [Anaerosporobacter sp.]|uniref:SpoIID/LytB domain-containing protein n=1 Tax=Anaerosporobacter sp. TaxID=1872529 RepID=UPI00286F5DB8|nr:SpoIID/LytB domain-containing protein [Anaerosporobacter sp.]
MKHKIYKLLLLLLIIVLIPYGITYLLSGKRSNSNRTQSNSIRISVEENGVDKEYSLDTYIMMAMAADIPVNYEMETLKAQATILRTYVYVIAEKKSGNVLTAEDIGLQYKSMEAAKASWGEENAQSYEKKLAKAIEDTNNMVITYNNSLIIPLFHPVSVGMTRSSKHAIGEDIVYLSAVESKGDVQSNDYMKISSIPKETVIEKLKESYPECNIEKDSILDDIVIDRRDEDGYIKSIQLGEENISGDVFASLFELNSTNFYIETYEDSLRFICKGKGHGLGLSQYGANLMALQGYKYNEILEYYFTKTQVKEYIE